MANLDYLLPGDYFEENLKKKVLPYLKERQEIVSVSGYDGALLHGRFYRQTGSDTVICISHGFCEFADKYSEIIYYFLQAGYSVAIMEHRGHGSSYRLLDNPSKIHIDTYDTYVKDYHCFVEQVKKVFADQHRILFGHSMGGCIAGLYAEAYPDDFEKLVLSSPMLEISGGGIPPFLCRLYGSLMVLLGKGEQYLGNQDQDWKPDEKFEDSCSLERGRFEAYKKMRIDNPACQTGAGTIRWMTESLKAAPRAVRNASKIRIPVLLMQAGRDNMVLPHGQEVFISHVRNGRLVTVPYSKHEIFNGDGASRLAFWKEVMTFIEEK